MPNDYWLIALLGRAEQGVDVREQGSRGHELMLRGANLGFRAMHRGSMYRPLRQTEKECMSLSERDGLDCRLPRRKYSITESGEVYMEFWANSLTEHREAIDLFLGVYSGEALREAY